MTHAATYAVVLVPSQGEPILIGLCSARMDAMNLAFDAVNRGYAVSFLEQLTGRWRSIPIHNVAEIYVAKLAELDTWKPRSNPYADPERCEPVTGCNAFMRDSPEPATKAEPDALKGRMERLGGA